MNRRKSRQQHRKEAADRVINVLSALLETANIAFSTNHNKQFGMREFTTILAEMTGKSDTPRRQSETSTVRQT